jgi:hypothetical protein|tara:strand:+ start:155 stop:514 length:360 start_codon:yes stop_codon:yes gene_type:complete
MAKYLKINVVNAATAEAEGNRIVPIDNVASVDYTTNSSLTITYSTSATANCVIAYAAATAGDSVAPRDAVINAMQDALGSGWQNIYPNTTGNVITSPVFSGVVDSTGLPLVVNAITYTP